MLEVTTTGRHTHVGSQAFGEVHYCLVDVFLWQHFPDDVQLTRCLIRLRLEFIVLFQHGAQT